MNVLIADSETILLALAHKHSVRKFKPGIDLLLFGSAELRKDSIENLSLFTLYFRLNIRFKCIKVLK